MCEYRPGEPWYSYCFRQVCEKSQFVLAIAGFGMLWWYADKADIQQSKLIEIINASHKYQEAQTAAMQELTHYIKNDKGK